jgi:3-oxoacyl-[acyl-carrier protein] reductase
VRLKDRVAVVTGGGRGIGRAIVELLAGEGCDVTFLYRGNADAAAAVVAAAKDAGHAVSAVQADVRDLAACTQAVDAVADRNGRIDLLVNNAGVIRDNQLAAMSDEDVSAVLDTNIGGVFNMTRAVVPHMIMQRAGRIINLSSVAGDKGGRGQTNYAASKGAINAFTRALAVELAPRKITVNAVAPGVIETRMTAALNDLPQLRAAELAHTAMGRFGTPQDVTGAVAFLASSSAAYITGHTLAVDGGYLVV